MRDISGDGQRSYSGVTLVFPRRRRSASANLRNPSTEEVTN
jgi:hypothetical protein